MARKKLNDDSSAIQIVNPWTVNVDPNFDCDKFKHDVNKELKTAPNLPLQELKFILADVLSGDPDAVKRPEFACLNFSAIYAAIEWLTNNNEISDQLKADLITEPWRLSFKSKPPTPEEFLTDYYLGDLAETIYPTVRKWFCEILDPLKPYRDIILSSYIGSGKSYLTNLINMFTAVHYALMYNPWKFFSLSPSTVFVLTFGSFSQKKASEIYIEPLTLILEQAPFFEKVRTHELLRRKDIEMSNAQKLEKVYWTSATPTSELQFSNNLNVKMVASANSIIGMTMITFALTEISFFYENGWSDEKLMRFYSKGKQRINSRLHGNYYGRTILDSSPGSLENAIDQYIWNDAPLSKLNYIVSGSRWFHIKEDYPSFYDENKNEIHDFSVAFPLFKGGNGKVPTVCDSPEEAETYDPVDLLWVPRYDIYNQNLYDQARENPLEFMRDFGGIPAGMQERIFYDQAIVDAIFNNSLKNLDYVINADSLAEPEHLIWDQVKDTLFYKVLDKYYFNYKPDIPRAIGVDQSYAEDICSIALSHVERDTRLDPTTGEPIPIYVTDFTINIHAGTGQINLDAIRYFILDLVNIGNMNIRAVAFDNFQSIPTRQALKRFGLEVDYCSMDKTNQPYLTFVDLIFKKRYVCGKNTILKNNLKSLQMMKRNTKKGTYKVEHTKGEVPLVGEQAGKNAKDTSDAAGASVYELTLYPERFIPYSLWDPNVIDRSYNTVKNDVMKQLNVMGKTVYR